MSDPITRKAFEIFALVYDHAGTLSLEFDATPYFDELTLEQLNAYLEQPPENEWQSRVIAECCSAVDESVVQFFAQKPEFFPRTTKPNDFDCEYNLEHVGAYVKRRNEQVTRAPESETPLEQQLALWAVIDPKRVFRRKTRQPKHQGINSWCLAMGCSSYSPILVNSPVNSRKFFELLAKLEPVPDAVLALMLEPYIRHLCLDKEVSE
jgi:hypothetical protein